MTTQGNPDTRPTIAEDIEAVVEDGTRLANAISQPDRWNRNLLDRVQLSMNGQPKAANYAPSCSKTPEPEPCADWPEGIPAPSRSDPTGEAAIRHDKAAADKRELARHIRTARKALDQAVRIAQRYEARQPHAGDAMELERTNAKPEPGCEWCAQTEVADGVARWEPVHQRVTLDTTEDGEALRVALCSWCCGFWLHTSTKPSRKQLADHHAGKRVLRRPAEQSRRAG